MPLNYLKNNYFVSVVSRIVIVFFTFMSSVLISRYLGPELKGVYSYIFNFVAILALILNFGIGQSYAYFKKNVGEYIQKDFITIYYYQLLIYLLFIFILNFFYTDYILNMILLASVLTQFNSQINFMATITNINKRNINNVFAILIQILVLILIYILTDQNLNWVIFAVFIRLLFNTISLIYQNNFIPLQMKIDTVLLKRIIRFSFFPMLTSLLITLNYNLDIIILKEYVTFSQVGIYSVSVALATILWVLPDAFKDVLFNKTSTSDSINDIVFSIKFNLMMCFIIIIGFIIFGETFIRLFYGIDFIDSYFISIILFIGAIPMIFFKMINTLYISIGKQKFAFYILFVAVVSNIIMNIILIPIFELSGAAFSSVLSYMICGFVFLISFMKKYKISTTQFLTLNKDEKLRIKQFIYKLKSFST